MPQLAVARIFSYKVIKVSCLCSALQDRRFEPMSHREVAALSCTVSLLCAFERAASWQDWSIGVHGLIIEFFGELPSLCADLWCRC